MAERRELIAEVAENLKKRGFEVHIAATPEEGKVTALALIPEGDSVCWGGSETVRELGIIEALRAAGKNKLIDRASASTPEETAEIMRSGLLADTFVTSVNAVSRDGWLVNIDGTGNRVAATIYGPRNIVLVVGVNKLVDGGLDDAIYRARNVAAPLNTKRLGRKTPCAASRRTRYAASSSSRATANPPTASSSSSSTPNSDIKEPQKVSTAAPAALLGIARSALPR